MPVEDANAKKYKVPKDQQVLKLINEATGADALNPDEIDVLVWNIYKGEMKGWKKDFAELSKGKEILILQESMLHSRVSDQYRDMNWLQFIFATAWYKPKYKNSESGLTTASVATSLRKQWQRSKYREPFIKTPKMTLFTEYKLQGKSETLLVGNIHGINFVSTKKLKHMMKKAAEVIRGHKGPVIFAGDFNTWSKKKIRSMNSIFKGLKMKALKFKKGARKLFRGYPLDHFWVKDMEILETGVPGGKASDHPPLVAKLRVI